jgi:hypothetical protein
MSYFIALCSKNSLFVPNLALIAVGDSHHSQGGMKFATQISPLLNLIGKFLSDVQKVFTIKLNFHVVQ